MPYIAKSLEQRLLDKVVVVDGHWIFTGSGSQKYARIKEGGNTRVTLGAHVAAFKVWKGPVPPGMCVCHKCDIPRCINPECLFLGTHLDNARDRDAKGRHWVPRGKASPNWKHGKYAEYV